MHFRYGNKVYKMEDPVPGPDEALVHVDRVIPVEYEQHAWRQVFMVNNVIRKILFFLWREGLSLTFSKSKTSLLMQKILSERKMVIAQGYQDDQLVLALGPQNCIQTDTMLFHKNLISPIGPHNNIEQLITFIINYLRNNERLIHDLFYYSSFSRRKIDFNLQELLKQDLSNNSTNENTPKPIFHVSDLKAASIRTYQSASAANNTGFDLFVIGAGAYTISHVLPHCREFRLNSIIDANPALAAYVGDKFKFMNVDNSAERGLQKLADARNPVVIIATYHADHLPLAELAIQYNPNTRIMIEKPPVTTKEQLAKLVNLRKIRPMIEIGYNRRYAPFTQTALQYLKKQDGPTTVTCIIKEKKLPLEHWYYWPNQGSRVTGNLSHWIDLGCGFIRQRPIHINATSASSRVATDEPAISILFQDGSCLCLIASDRGDSMRGVQEYIDIRKGDMTIRIDDFITMDIMFQGRRKKIHRRIRDKGHKRMYRKFKENCLEGKQAIYSDFDLIISSLLCADITEMLQNGQKSSAVDYAPYLGEETSINS